MNEIFHQNTAKIGWGYMHDGRADKYPYPHDRRADKDSYPHDRWMWLTICVAYLNFVLHLLWFYGYFFDLMCSIVINAENYLLKQCLNH